MSYQPPQICPCCNHPIPSSQLNYSQPSYSYSQPHMHAQPYKQTIRTNKSVVSSSSTQQGCCQHECYHDSYYHEHHYPSHSQTPSVSAHGGGGVLNKLKEFISPTTVATIEPVYQPEPLYSQQSNSHYHRGNSSMSNSSANGGNYYSDYQDDFNAGYGYPRTTGVIYIVRDEGSLNYPAKGMSSQSSRHRMHNSGNHHTYSSSLEVTEVVEPTSKRTVTKSGVVIEELDETPAPATAPRQTTQDKDKRRDKEKERERDRERDRLAREQQQKEEKRKELDRQKQQKEREQRVGEQREREKREKEKREKEEQKANARAREKGSGVTVTPVPEVRQSDSKALPKVEELPFVPKVTPAPSHTPTPDPVPEGKKIVSRKEMQQLLKKYNEEVAAGKDGEEILKTLSL